MVTIIPRLSVSASCKDAPEGASIVHACKSPCWCHAVGANSLPSEHPNYLSLESGQDLFLNLIDPPTPLFKAKSFHEFMAFASEQWTAGRSLHIHCNKGESRSPSLALLFLAKCLGAIPDESFDDAWDAFAELCEGYQPGKGIETYLREHWREFDQTDRLPYIAGAGAGSSDKSGADFRKVAASISDLSESQAVAIISGSPLLHFSGGFVKVRDKENRLRSPDLPGVFQRRVCEAYEWLMMNNAPVRIVEVKPRQVGGTTISAEICYHHTRRYHTNGMMLADEGDRTSKLWDMFNTFAEHDSFPWDSRHEYNSERSTFFFAEEDGSESKAVWESDTANDPKAGASGTRQVLLFSEAGRYNKAGRASDQQVISNAMSSVPEKPGTVVFLESTAEGASGYFFTVVKGDTEKGLPPAVTLEERKASNIGNGWVLIFSAWHECEDYQLPRAGENERYFSAALDVEEKRGVELYGWTAEQIAWRRAKLQGQFSGNVALFKQEYPSSLDEAFQSSGSPRFNVEGVTRLEKQALSLHQYARRGTLEDQEGNLTFVQTNDAPWLWVKEEPLYKCAYIAFADPMTGEQSAGSAQRDSHACGIIRAAYMNKDGDPVNPELVACIDIPNGCRWEMDVLCEKFYRVMRWYGDCMVVPESNNAGVEFIRLMRMQGASIYRREKEDHIMPGKKLEIHGFQTTNATRNLWVGAVADAIKDQSFDCAYSPAVAQMKTFIINEDGKAIGKTGCLDDFVTGIGLGLLKLDLATTRMPPARVSPHARVKTTGNMITQSRGKGAFG